MQLAVSCGLFVIMIGAVGDLQVTYRATFPSIIPPPFFNSLIASVYSYRATAAAATVTGSDVIVPTERPHYWAHEIVEWIRIDSVGCVDCRRVRRQDDRTVYDEMMSEQSLHHQVLIELLAQSSVVQVCVLMSGGDR